MALTGIDISGWQAGIPLNTVPCDFVIIKATGGNGFVAQSCDAEYQAARAAGKLVGIYHFAHESGFQSDAVTEANFFLANVKGYLNGDTLLVLDFEGDNWQDVAWAKLWLDTVFAATGVRPIVYLNMNELTNSDWSPVYNANYGLWVARYAVTSPTQGYNNYAGTPAVNDAFPAVNWGGNAPVLWQFADNAQLPGWPGGLDADILNGDAATWHAYCRPVNGSHPAPAPAPAPAPRPAPAPHPAVIGQCTVTAGDTLSSIGAQVGVNWQSIAAVNPGINPDVIQVGQVLNLPAGANLAALSGAAPHAQGLPPYCIVEAGDTLGSVAAQFGVTEQYILSRNPSITNPNLIYVGQRINF